MNTEGYDLTKESGVVFFMMGAKSAADWNNRCDAVKAANDGQYPDFWYKAIILGGIYDGTRTW